MNKKRGFSFYILVLVLIFFYLPLVVVVINSFNNSRYGGSWNGFTLNWYLKVFQDEKLFKALINTLIIAFSSTAISLILGTLSAYALYRYKSRLQKMHSFLIYVPLVIPDILVGISLLLFFVALKIDLGLGTILIAHISFCLSYVILAVSGRLQNFDYAIIEAAKDLGANKKEIFTQILFPLIAPGLVAGALMSFTLSLDDFAITFFVAGPGTATLPIYIYGLMRHGTPAEINALSTIIIIFTFLIMIFAKKLRGAKQ